MSLLILFISCWNDGSFENVNVIYVDELSKKKKKNNNNTTYDVANLWKLH